MVPDRAGDRFHLNLHESVNVVSGCLEVGLGRVPYHCPCVLGEGQVHGFASVPDVNRAPDGDRGDNHIAWTQCDNDVPTAMVILAVDLEWVFFSCLGNRLCLRCSASLVRDILRDPW